MFNVEDIKYPITIIIMQMNLKTVGSLLASPFDWPATIIMMKYAYIFVISIQHPFIEIVKVFEILSYGRQGPIRYPLLKTMIPILVVQSFEWSECSKSTKINWDWRIPWHNA